MTATARSPPGEERFIMDGIPEANIVSCYACHGPNGEGIRDIPRLGGLAYFYVKARLEQWEQGLPFDGGFTDADGGEPPWPRRNRGARLLSQLREMSLACQEFGYLTLSARFFSWNARSAAARDQAQVVAGVFKPQPTAVLFDLVKPVRAGRGAGRSRRNAKFEHASICRSFASQGLILVQEPLPQSVTL